MNEAEALARASQAKAILDAPIYQDAYANCRAAIIALMEKTPLSETQTAEDLRRCLKLLRDVQANMAVAMSTGKLAEFRLAQEEARRKNPLRGLFR